MVVECIYCAWDMTSSVTPRTENYLVYDCWRCGRKFEIPNPNPIAAVERATQDQREEEADHGEKFEEREVGANVVPLLSRNGDDRGKP